MRRLWRRKPKPELAPLSFSYPMPTPPPGAAFLEAVWTCGGCGRRWSKRVSVDQPVVTIACPDCDAGNPAALLVTEAVEDDG